MKVINLYGGPCSGKSTTAAGLFYKMKLKHLSVELVTEYAKDLVYSNRLEDMLDQQEYIFAKQNQRLHCLRNHVDWAITDSPLLLSNVYANDEWPCVTPFKQLVYETFETYDNVNIFLERPKEFQDYGRRHDKEQSEEIDNKIKQLLDEKDYHYETFDINGLMLDNLYYHVLSKGK